MAEEQPQEQAPDTLAEFTILPLTLPTMPSYSTATKHYLYLRPHAPRIPGPDDSRSLFAANIPADATAAHFKTLFATSLGGVRLARVDFDSTTAPHNPSTAPRGKKRKRSAAALAAQQTAAGDDSSQRLEIPLPRTWDRTLHASGASCVLVFVDRASRDLALKAARRAAEAAAGKKGARKDLVWAAGVDAPSLGSRRYGTHHALSYPAHSDLQKAVDEYMAAFGAAEARRAREQAAQRAVPDADGFVTVARGSRTGPARAEEAAAALARARAREDEKRSGRGAFYRFQVREKLKMRERELVRRFEEDRRVAEALGGGGEDVFVPS